MTLRILQCLALILTALAFVPAGAHLLALPNKIDLPQADYFTVQATYAGWALFGVVSLGALFVNSLLAIRLRRHRPAFQFALIGAFAMAVFFAIFFTWTYPANVATANWTHATENWRELRLEWEYSHAVNAIVVFIGFCSIVLAVTTAEERSG